MGDSGYIPYFLYISIQSTVPILFILQHYFIAIFDCLASRSHTTIVKHQTPKKTIMTSSNPKILLTGATGYIGGTILSHLIGVLPPSTSITLLLRDPSRGSTLISEYGNRVQPIFYKDLDDTEAATAVAADHDIIINTTDGFHSPSSLALIKGLAKRKEKTGRDVWIIHTSGVANLADQSFTGLYVEKDSNKEFDDAKDDIYVYEKERETLSPFGQRTVELALIDLAEELGVKTIVVESPLIYGVGTGLFNKTSIQIPIYIRAALAHGRSIVVDNGKGIWDHVHVEDLAELYTVILRDVIENEGKDLPSCKKGIMFSGNGRHTWHEVAQGVADALFEEGKLEDSKVESVSFEEGVKLLSVPEVFAELGFSSTSRTVSSVARNLGWKPSRGEQAWKATFGDDLKAVLG